MEPGKNTSEFKLTVLVMLIGSVLDAVGICLEALQKAGVVQNDSHWFTATLVVVGTVMMLAKALGYTRSRTMLKLAELQPMAIESAKVTVPLAKAVAEILKEEMRAKKAASLPPAPSPEP